LADNAHPNIRGRGDGFHAPCGCGACRVRSSIGHTPFAHIKAMITGWEYEKADESAAVPI
jgi:hypothetical protein